MVMRSSLIDGVLKTVAHNQDHSNPIKGTNVYVDNIDVDVTRSSRDLNLVLPVIPKGSRQDIVSASLKKPYLWDHCNVLKLTANMRLYGQRLKDGDKNKDSHNGIKVRDASLENHAERISIILLEEI
ncbi:ATP-dependent DNA helicase PIF1-like protein [Tanacetum coccineum]|uniref:ATP-dependent DNA helicase n=1 Tax=Tanacetum coccineum TaxID=301880 RepID=A0ABQ5GP65_9ASTR